METDTELEDWRRQWQSEAIIPRDLIRRVEHAMRMRRLSFAGAIAVTLSFGLGVPAWALASRRIEVAVLAAGIWVFIGIAWMISLSLDKGLSRPIASTASAFLDFSIQWCERRRRGVAAGSALYAAILTFNLGWLYTVQPVKSGLWPFLTSPHVLTVLAITVVLAVVAIWNRRRIGRERDRLVSLRRQIEG